MVHFRVSIYTSAVPRPMINQLPKTALWMLLAAACVLPACLPLG